ncbi:PREDICTED: uncharacterized protein LOC106806216 [Priapulus caudatus]|uniref:Uncharacterized protein LOC106806216 n=1 Tax=Priapulus caudatus TaxID=37621 RepID=A0ABM1DUF5_PRICU|nr:PREDICTED: uncharacterized protein LOC106806216 [Priapulus caudatus]
MLFTRSLTQDRDARGSSPVSNVEHSKEEHRPATRTDLQIPTHDQPASPASQQATERSSTTSEDDLTPANVQPAAGPQVSPHAGRVVRESDDVNTRKQSPEAHRTSAVDGQHDDSSERNVQENNTLPVNSDVVQPQASDLRGHDHNAQQATDVSPFYSMQPVSTSEPVIQYITLKWPRAYFKESVLSCVCCPCWCISIAAIYNSMMVRDLRNTGGDIAEAAEASKRTKLLIIISIVVGILVWFILVLSVIFS